MVLRDTVKTDVCMTKRLICLVGEGEVLHSKWKEQEVGGITDNDVEKTSRKAKVDWALE